MSINLCLILFLATAATGLANKDNTVSIANYFTWQCANSGSCIRSVVAKVFQGLKHGRAVDFGLASVVPVEGHKNVFKGRSWEFTDFLSGNAIKIPVGPMVFNIQKALDYENFLEISLLKKGEDQGRRRRDKKNMQMFLPMFLSFNAAGWTAMAIIAVKLLTIKALVVSKFAFFLTAGLIIKKMMEHASEKIITQHAFEHAAEPMVMPYNMDFGAAGHAFGAHEMVTPDIYPYSFGHDVGATSLHHAAAAAAGGYGAESSISATLIDAHNNTGQSMGLSNVGKIKRQDEWTGVHKVPMQQAQATSKYPIYVYRNT